MSRSSSAKPEPAEINWQAAAVDRNSCQCIAPIEPECVIGLGTFHLWSLAQTSTLVQLQYHQQEGQRARERQGIGTLHNHRFQFMALPVSFLPYPKYVNFLPSTPVLLMMS